ncbi:hypothetical protein COJ67_03355 [Bacillus thuringiensis]|uniref:hypothetical protein n=1 Tax=Bacillus thuringiensis TaxID=1428 RepID=UPI000BF8B724|nr:hypothetical protein [Bacillus thuringiensis]PFN92147.1 hypothetical protein COJ67_03355 [Bacillus thuringiensis]PGY05608.1 hypothetical protein COE41_03130 [Bacillus thuringiensis]
MKHPLLIGISFSDYKPGMKLCLHQDYETIQKEGIVTIEEMSGYNMESNTFKYPFGLGELFFITTDGVKIIWNDVSLSCYIERDDTTSFLEKMLGHYSKLAKTYLHDPSYEWSQEDYNQYLASKHETIIETILKYEYERIEKEKVTS